MHTPNVWFIALCYALVLKWSATTILAATHNSQRYKTASFQGHAEEAAESLGKSWGWKKQQPTPPQNNIFIITRPAQPSALPISPAISVGALTTSPVAVTSAITTPVSAQVVVRPINNRNRQQQNVNRYRNRLRNGNVNRLRRRRRPLGPGVYYAREDNDDRNHNGDDNHDDNDDNDSDGDVGDSKEKKNSQGVNSKLDIEQLEKSLNSPISRNRRKQIKANKKYDLYDDIAVSGEVSDEPKGSKPLSRRITKPQTTATFSPAVPTAFSIEPIITTRTSKLPTYAMAAITNGQINNSHKDDDNDDDTNNNRQSIFQGLTKRWRDRRKRRRNENTNKQKQQQLQKDEEENEHEIIIDKNEKIHIKRKREKQNHNNKNMKINKQQKQDTVVGEAEQQEVIAMNSLINDNNTNSRLQNIINAFRLRTPIIYKKQR